MPLTFKKMSPLSEEAFFNHLLWSFFSHHITHNYKLQIHCDLCVQQLPCSMYCFITPVPDIWVLFMLFMVSESHAGICMETIGPKTFDLAPKKQMTK